MKPVKKIKILIALDYNTTAQKVADEGYAFAKSMHAEVTLLHVMSDPLYYASVENSLITGLKDSLGVDPLAFDADHRLKGVSQYFLDTIKLKLGDKSINTVLEEGDFADTILMKAKSLEMDILVVGSHSHRWLEDIVMGSVTTKVLRLTTIPLFIVPTKKRD